MTINARVRRGQRISAGIWAENTLMSWHLAWQAGIAITLVFTYEPASGR